MKHDGSNHGFTHEIVVIFQVWMYAHTCVASFYWSSNNYKGRTQAKYWFALIPSVFKRKGSQRGAEFV